MTTPTWIDTAIWRQSGRGTWYKSGAKHAYVIKICTRCTTSYLGLRAARFCSVACASGGDGKSYGWAHERVQRQKGLAAAHPCVGCGSQAAEWSYDGLDHEELVDPESGVKRYSLDPDHYEPRCHACHAAFDGHVGEGNGNAKLTNAQCGEIQRAAGVTQHELAVRFGVTQSHISRIRRGIRSGAMTQRPESAGPEDYRELVSTPTLALEAEEYLKGMMTGD